MIESKYFQREAVRSRMLNYAAKEWGYDNTELENFDPLVSLLMGGLSKELEKSYETFEESYARVVNHVIETLIPGNKLDFLPAHTIVNVENMNEMFTIDQSNISLKHTVTVENEDKEIEFVPILAYKTLPVKVKYIADGYGIYSVSGVDRFEEHRYIEKDNSIYIGFESLIAMDNANTNLDLYVDWLNYPDKDRMAQIGQMVKWSKNGQNLELFRNTGLDYFDEIAQDKFWSSYPFETRIKNVYKSYRKRVVSLKNVDFSKNVVPNFILNISNNESSLSELKELHWLKLELPPHSASKDFARHLFCQTNCFPFVNMNKRRLLKKVKAPFKILKLDTVDHFVNIRSIENTDGLKYFPHDSIAKIQDKGGLYRIISDGVQRINRKKASEAINNILDTIKEERNAFAAQNPDWIVDELLDIKKTINRIKGKLNITSEIKPSDVFVEFENDKSEDVLSIDYWSSNANEANNILAGTFFTIEGDSSSTNAFAVNTSLGGKSFIGSKQKLKNFQRSLYSRNTIVTANDVKLFIGSKLTQFNVKEISFQKILVSDNNRNAGYRYLYKVNVDLVNVEEGIDLQELAMIIEEECNSNTILGFEIQIIMNQVSDG